jgi:hypothetical protein
MYDDALPKVTAAMLRQAGSMCARRLKLEHQNQRGNRLGSGRFRVANQLTEHARLAQLELGPPQASAFVPLGLEAEERAVYTHAAATYLDLFGDRAARAVDLDEWETEVPELRIRLVGNGAVAFEDHGGRPELRFLSIGDVARDATDPHSAVTRFTILRYRDWLSGRTVRVVHTELLFGGIVQHDIEVGAYLDDADTWLRERVELIGLRLQDAAPHVGLECGRCKFVAGCPAHA